MNQSNAKRRLPPAGKRATLWLSASVLAIGVCAIAYAAPVKTWTDGETLSAADLNDSFANLQTQVSTLVPPGTIIAYAGAIDGNPDERINGKAPEHPPPPGWLWCNGNQLNGLSAKFAGLYAAIGITFGGNGGSQAFNLPDLRGVFLRGQDQVRGQGQGTSVDPDTATRKIGSFQGWSTAQARNVFVTSASGDHTHAMSTEVAGAPMWYDCAGCNNWHAAQGSNWGMGHASHTHNINNAGTHTHSISGGDDETRPSNITVNYLIKY